MQNWKTILKNWNITDLKADGQVGGRAGKWAGRWVAGCHAFFFGTTVWKVLYLHLWISAYIWSLHVCSSWAFWASYYHRIYSSFFNYEKYDKIFFVFISGPELLDSCTCLHKNMLWNMLDTQGVPFWSLRTFSYSMENMKFWKKK